MLRIKIGKFEVEVQEEIVFASLAVSFFVCLIFSILVEKLINKI